MGILPRGAGKTKWCQEVRRRLQGSVSGPPSYGTTGARLEGMLPFGHPASS